MLTEKTIPPGGDLSDAFDIRTEVFVKEQGFSKELEFDDIDVSAYHVVIYDDGVPVATGRTFVNADKLPEYILGRIAVLERFRGAGLGRRVVSALESAAKEQGAAYAKLGAQCHARQFYEKSGYSVFGGEFLEEGVPHIYMRKAL